MEEDDEEPAASLPDALSLRMRFIAACEVFGWAVYPELTMAECEGCACAGNGVLLRAERAMEARHAELIAVRSVGWGVKHEHNDTEAHKNMKLGKDKRHEEPTS